MLSKIKVGLVTPDRVYADRFMAYLRLSEYRNLLMGMVYTDLRVVLSQESGHDLKEPPDVWLVDEDVVIGLDWNRCVADNPLLSKCKVVVLVTGDSVVVPGEGEQEVLKLSKYQPLNLLLDRVLEWGSTNGSRAMATGAKSSCWILSAYSAVGGAGKTVFIQSAAAVLARMGYRPLVVSLESLPSPCWQEPHCPDHFSRLIYESRGGELVRSRGLGRFMVEAPNYHYRYLPAPSNLEELEQLDEDTVASLLANLADSGSGDVLLVDLDSSRSARVLSALKVSHHTVCLVSAGVTEIHKTRMMLEQKDSVLAKLLEEGRCSLLLNRCTKASEVERMGLQFPVEELLPLESGWNRGGDCGAAPFQKGLLEERLQVWLTAQLSKAENNRTTGGRIAIGG